MTLPPQPAVSPRIIRPYEGVGIPPVPIKQSHRHRRSQHAVPAASTNPETKTETETHTGATKAYRQPSIDWGGTPREETHVGSSGRHLPSELSPPAPLSFIHVSPPLPPGLTAHQRVNEWGREGYKGRGLVTQLSSEIFPARAPCSQRPSVFGHFSMSRGGAGVRWGGGNPVELWL